MKLNVLPEDFLYALNTNVLSRRGGNFVGGSLCLYFYVGFWMPSRPLRQDQDKHDYYGENHP